ncbi:raftlin [Rhinophrynus dorsalis]
MGCGLNKLEKLDDKRPGNIYSTLKRPHVETKIDVAYEYRYVDFTTLSQAYAPRTPAIRLTSLCDLPVHLLDLYQQGFTVTAIHPFVQSSNEADGIPQEQIYRVVLIKKTERNSTSDSNNEEYSLELEMCAPADQLTDQKLIPDLVKRIEDAASQGSKFAGIIQGYCIAQNLPQSPSDSLSQSSSPEFTSVKKICSDIEDNASGDTDKPDFINRSTSPAVREEYADHSKVLVVDGLDTDQENQQSAHTAKDSQLEDINVSSSADDVFSQDKITKKDPTLPDNCSIRTKEILAIFNKPKTQQRYRKYYTVNIPMKISRDGNTINGLEANWLEHMTDHFRKGCTLVNALFYLGMVNDSSSEFTDGVFIFEDYPEQDPKTIRRYDAIVVEQWTILEGLEVQTDYMPLLNSLAVYGWQLTCVLPTPIVKTNRDGNVTTKQIVFLQRPTLPHKMKKKEPKFQWKFSKDDKHSKHSKKVKGNRNSKENQHVDGNKELERNRKNEEPPKIEDTGDGNIHGNHLQDGNEHSKNDSPNEEVVAPPKQEVISESQESLTPSIHNPSLHVEGLSEGLNDTGAEKNQCSHEEAFRDVVISEVKESETNEDGGDAEVLQEHGEEST